MVYIYIPNSCSTFWPKTGRLWRFRRLWWLLTSRLVAFWALWCSMGHSAHCKVLVQFSSCQGKYNEVTYLYISKDRNNDAKKGERWCWLPIDGWGDKARSSSSSFLEITCELGLLSHFWFSAWLHTSAPVSSKKYQKAWQKWKHENGQKNQVLKKNLLLAGLFLADHSNFLVEVLPPWTSVTQRLLVLLVNKVLVNKGHHQVFPLLVRW